MKRRWISTLAVLLLFIVGLGILLYPTISDRWNKMRAARLVVEYDTVIEEKSEEELDNTRLIAEAYNMTLLGNVLPDAFAELQLPPDHTYDSVLDPTGTGYMGTVDIPKIDVNLPIFHYTTEEVLERGAGHLAGSSLPVGGESTHCVVSAHRGLPSAKLFTDLDKITKGDVFFLHTLGETLAYEVDFIKTIEPTDTSELSIQNGKDLCTLFTCTPYAVNTHRLLVRGHRVPFTAEVYEQEAKKPVPVDAVSTLIRILCAVAGLLLAFVIIFIMSLLQRRRARRLAAAAEEDESEDNENTEETKTAGEENAVEKDPENTEEIQENADGKR